MITLIHEIIQPQVKNSYRELKADVVLFLIPVSIIMFRKSPSNNGQQDDQIPIIVNESIEDDILSSEQHVTEGK